MDNDDFCIQGEEPTWVVKERKVDCRPAQTHLPCKPLLLAPARERPSSLPCCQTVYNRRLLASVRKSMRILSPTVCWTTRLSQSQEGQHLHAPPLYPSTPSKETPRDPRRTMGTSLDAYTKLEKIGEGAFSRSRLN